MKAHLRESETPENGLKRTCLGLRWPTEDSPAHLPDSSSPNSPKFKDISGQRFGKLVAVRPLGKTELGVTTWLCRCDCGNILTVRGSHLRTKNSKSCGCSFKQAKPSYRHGHAGRVGRSAEYAAWTGMIARCENPNRREYKNYGGRGIKVCDRWRNSFENFLADIGPRPGPQYSLDRYPNNDGNYEPGNCRWATQVQQQRNKRPRAKSFKSTLIAAAPELLAALEHMLSMTQDGWITPEDKPTDWQLGWEAACEQFKIAKANDIAEAAIRKAKGGTS